MKTQSNMTSALSQLFGLTLKGLVYGLALLVIGTVLCVSIFIVLAVCLWFAVQTGNPLFLLPHLGAFLLFVFIWMRL
jgi:hypothetical protein